MYYLIKTKNNDVVIEFSPNFDPNSRADRYFEDDFKICEGKECKLDDYFIYRHDIPYMGRSFLMYRVDKSNLSTLKKEYGKTMIYILKEDANIVEK